MQPNEERLKENRNSLYNCTINLNVNALFRYHADDSTRVLAVVRVRGPGGFH